MAALSSLSLLSINTTRNDKEKMEEITNNTATINLQTPEAIKKYLDQYVIGQDAAKKTLAVAVYNHYKRVLLKMSGADTDTEIDKSNVLLIGETGCGKTLLVKTIARLLNVPYYIQDSTKMTASGYVGEDVESCLSGLLRSCGYDLRKAQYGIVMLDEIDKTARTEAGPSITKDVSGEGVQQSLLKIVEGETIGIQPQGGRKHPEQPLTYIDTTNILFIASGAFVGIEDIIRRRMGGMKIGFVQKNNEDGKRNEKPVHYVMPQDIRDFGFIPEFVGRFPVIAYVDSLDEDSMMRILSEPKNSIVRQYESLLSMDGVEVNFTDDALRAVVKYAMGMKTGARGLRNIMETVMSDYMFKAPSMSEGSVVEIGKGDIEMAVETRYGISKVA